MRSIVALIVGISIYIVFYFLQFVLFLFFLPWVGGFAAGLAVGFLVKDWLKGVVGALLSTFFGSLISGGMLFAYHFPHAVGLGLASGLAAGLYAYIPSIIGAVSGVLIGKRQQSM